ncbi:TetR/AcrR family transcriptional regulator [Bacillus sp. BRMEA1]|uniref:TetR/AcrR family transcriptional regulator n=1 Tax=Neobacillus endophyticus TaxID=2738405 RepID=UPI0015679E4B|nr:TetR/AcrR family transcriptional regulator [Neobacillus endophyticus]NRD76815.1 TetR/AcrR family transcriptional regulator [Neobacillus endophyticus]
MSNTREHILNVSFKLFLKKNFKEVTMKEIVEETGISKGAFYHHFESKEQLFLEVLNHSIASVTAVYKDLSKDSLRQFYHDYFYSFRKMETLFPIDAAEDSIFELNIFSLFFDGIKMFPGFQDKLQEVLQFELNSWKEIVQIAREKGEISSCMSDEHVAKMFIYSSDGIGMHSFISKGNGEEARTALIDLWNGFYEELKC